VQAMTRINNTPSIAFVIDLLAMISKSGAAFGSGGIIRTILAPSRRQKGQAVYGVNL